MDCRWIRARGSIVLRLDKIRKRHRLYIMIEGELRSESVGTVESACLSALAGDVPVTVLVKNVTEIDADGYAFLRRLVATKATVRARGIYSQYVLKHIKLGVVD